MKFFVAFILTSIASNGFADTRNCDKKEVEDYAEEYEHHSSKDGSPGFIYMQGSKAHEQYLKLSVAEKNTSTQGLFTKTVGNIKCTKEEMKSLDCAQYTCVIQEN